MMSLELSTSGDWSLEALDMESGLQTRKVTVEGA